jgi:nucleoside-diphosphate-sugar epimerase
VDDVVRAALLAAEKPASAGQVYIVTDGQLYSTGQIYQWIVAVLGRSAPRWSVPLSVLTTLARCGDTVGRLLGRRVMLDSDSLGKLIGSACYSSDKIVRELGFTPTRNLRGALPDIVAYLGLR